MKVLGIDPGLKGACVFIENGHIEGFLIMPVTGGMSGLDIPSLCNWISHQSPDVAYVEKIHSLFVASKKSTFTFGMNYGVLFGILASLKIPYIQVPPKQWQKEMCEGVEEKYDQKVRAQIAANRLFPRVDFTRGKKNPHDGMIDAALIALYGYRKVSSAG